jgi:hypothetical protein
MNFKNFMDIDFQKMMEVCFDFFRFCVILCEAEKTPQLKKTYIFLIQSILFSNGGLHREKKD